MPDYKKGKIYCIRSHQTDEIYIGSTTQSLSKRMVAHRTKYKRFLNKKTNYITSYKILQFKDAYIELLHCSPCNSMEELHRAEGKYIREMKCVNKCIPCRTKKEHYNDNKEQIILKVKQYREDNKDTRLLKEKKYREENKEQLSLKSKKYREKNKEKLALIAKQKYTCACGSIIAKYGKQRHFRSKKHIKYIQEN